MLWGRVSNNLRHLRRASVDRERKAAARRLCSILDAAVSTLPTASHDEDEAYWMHSAGALPLCLDLDAEQLQALEAKADTHAQLQNSVAWQKSPPV